MAKVSTLAKLIRHKEQARRLFYGEMRGQNILAYLLIVFREAEPE
ncbi:MAG: hypothetical protein SXA11_02785 [Cyanobacteriota bacterium]|nr:hypothetical protein [Cyanobacteriota bacterium]